MSLDVVRLDDRLVHGQVVVGWGNAMDLQRIVVIDEGLRQNDWEQDIYRMGIPDSIELIFASIAEGRESMADWARDEVRTMVIVGDVETLMRICHESVVIKEVNVGGVHQAPGRTERLRYVFLTEAEYSGLQEIASWSIDVTAQDLPSAKPVNLEALA